MILGAKLFICLYVLALNIHKKLFCVDDCIERPCFVTLLLELWTLFYPVTNVKLWGIGQGTD